jgi:hypothetical protein
MGAFSDSHAHFVAPLRAYALLPKRRLGQALAMPSPDTLLIRLSAQGQGTWSQFRSIAVASYAAPGLEHDGAITATTEAPSGRGVVSAIQRCRFALERLAHVEFFSAGCEEGWRVAPAAISAALRDCHARGLLCGARNPDLLKRIRDLPDWKRTYQSGGDETAAPLAIRLLTRDLEELAALSRQLGIGFQEDAPVRVLTRLRPIPSAEAASRPSEFPQGSDWKVSVFEVGPEIRWKDVHREEADRLLWGLFRFRHPFLPAKYFFKLYGSVSVTDRGTAVYAWLGKHARSVIHYECGSERLVIHATCRPPLLVERALILCSGSLPTFNRERLDLTYRDVPEHVARLASRVLRQDLS